MSAGSAGTIGRDRDCKHDVPHPSQQRAVSSTELHAAAGVPVASVATAVFQAPAPLPPPPPLPQVTPKVSLLALSGKDEEEQDKMTAALKSYENGDPTVCPMDDLSEQFDESQNKGRCSWLSGICHQTIKIGTVVGTGIYCAYNEYDAFAAYLDTYGPLAKGITAFGVVVMGAVISEVFTGSRLEENNRNNTYKNLLKDLTVQYEQIGKFAIFRFLIDEQNAKPGHVRRGSNEHEEPNGTFTQVNRIIANLENVEKALQSKLNLRKFKDAKGCVAPLEAALKVIRTKALATDEGHTRYEVQMLAFYKKAKLKLETLANELAETQATRQLKAEVAVMKFFAFVIILKIKHMEARQIALDNARAFIRNRNQTRPQVNPNSPPSEPQPLQSASNSPVPSTQLVLRDRSASPPSLLTSLRNDLYDDWIEHNRVAMKDGHHIEYAVYVARRTGQDSPTAAAAAKPTIRSRPLARLMAPSIANASSNGSAGSTGPFQSPKPTKGVVTPNTV